MKNRIFHMRRRYVPLIMVILLLISVIPWAVQAITLTEEIYENPRVKVTWDESVWKNALGSSLVEDTGLAFNWHPFSKDRTQAGFPFDNAPYFTARPGYVKEKYKDFDDHFIYCVASHVQNYRLEPGYQAFYERGYNTKTPFPSSIKGANEKEIKFNFLMLALACSYPGDSGNASSSANVPYYLVNQTIAWLATDESAVGQERPGFKGDWDTDFQYYKQSNVYAALTYSFPEDVSPQIYQTLHAPVSQAVEGHPEITMMMDYYFYEIWSAANLTSKLTPDWDKNITTFNAEAKEEGGEYHAYMDLFYSEEARIYLTGMDYVPYGDWQIVDIVDGMVHFKSATGETDLNGAIGQLMWIKDRGIRSIMPVDETKAKLYAFVFYNDTIKGNDWSMNNSQTYFSTDIEQDIQLNITLQPPKSEGGKKIEVKRYEHTEGFEARYNVNLIKYDSETGKPLADSYWDILEAFDDTQLQATNLDREAGQPGSYEPGFGELISSTWGTNDIESNYQGNMGLNQSDSNLYNWGNDGGTQFKRWDDPHNDPCERDINVTGEDGKLHEINSAGEISPVVAHTDIKKYEYHKGYCGGHPAPIIEYQQMTENPDIDGVIEEENQELHNEAWAAWLDEVKKCEQLVSEGGFFHAIQPGVAQKALEADRDQFYADFISLTYDYSAEETRAAKGYTLHGIHTDDIPIEWRTVTSSEYKATKQASEISHTNGSDENGEEEEDEKKDNLKGNSISFDFSGYPLDGFDDMQAGLSTPSAAVKHTNEFTLELDDDIYADYELNSDDTIVVYGSPTATTSIASPSNAGYVERIKSGFLKGLLKSDQELEENDEEQNFLRAVVKFDESEASIIIRPDGTIIDWTFIIYDHRIEGEIHINKRDFSVHDEESPFDDYGISNGDAVFEGAVYGLFAAQDIIHPDAGLDADRNSGIIYKKDNLVAVTTLDRNGDGSFFVNTEPPGYTYSYEMGTIVKTEDGWADKAPKNLYTNQPEADQKEKDAERFIGRTPSNDPIELRDSQSGADDTSYQKLSSNQGIEDTWSSETTGSYPIQNNESNNRNCWIGRPLIISKDGSLYYVKELARAEGYELSVYGKDSKLMTNRDAFLAGGDVFESGTAVVSEKSMDQINGGVLFDVSSNGTQNGYKIKINNMPAGAHLNMTKSEYVWDDTVTHPEERYHEENVMATAGTPVMVGDQTWKANIGDSISYNNKTFTVNQVYTVENSKRNIMPDNKTIIQHAHLDPAAVTPSGDVMTDVNTMFAQNGFKQVSVGSPWVSIKVPSASLEDITATINTQVLDDDWYRVFNSMQMLGSYLEGSDLYLMIGYSYRSHKINNYLYNEANGLLYVKTDLVYESPDGSDLDGYVYRNYLASDCENVITNSNNFITSAIAPNEIPHGRPVYLSGSLDGKVSYTVRENESYWAYADGDILLNRDGENVVRQVVTIEEVAPTLVEKTTNIEVPMESYLETMRGAGNYTFHVSQEDIDERTGNINFRILFDTDAVEIEGSEQGTQYYTFDKSVISIQFPLGGADSFIESVLLSYPGQEQVISDGDTMTTPVQVYERPIRQRIKVTKDIDVLKQQKEVWYCVNCGYENPTDTEECGHCDTIRTSEQTKTIRYLNDTYSAVHADNKAADGKGAGSLDWLNALLTGKEKDRSASQLPNFRYKLYLKSNLERLYRDDNGAIVWMDRNGNIMTPEYQDTNKDGNYDTFQWVYQDLNGKTADFPEQDMMNDNGILESSNVQKIYTMVEHNKDSLTTSTVANNVWDDYESPQSGKKHNVGEKEGFNTSQRMSSDGEAGDLLGKAVNSNASLYSYSGKNADVDLSDHINQNQNSGYTRLLETSSVSMPDNDATRAVEQYNYEKFFDAIAAANADIWDDDMHSTYTGSSMSNYPGQHWHESFYEKYQLDDADENYTIENTDGVDADMTAGGDRSTSFKPFRWIRENVFGDRADYERYPASHNGANTETVSSTSKFAEANAQASDAVRQFAAKWYLEDEAAVLMKNNGNQENIANPGSIAYDEEIYDEALFHAIEKTYQYLKPFYVNDLDTIYSVEWDSAPNGGADEDFTTLSIDLAGIDDYYNISSFVPYGVYIIVEQQPQRIDGKINDFENRSYTIEKPKELVVPTLYDGPAANDTTNNYHPYYTYQADMTTVDQAKLDNYLIRFGEEWTNGTMQDEREFVIRGHNNSGDFEVYKFGLDVDRLTGEISYPGGTYSYAGYQITQDIYDPLKDYYDTKHRGPAGIEEIGTEYGGNDNSEYYAIQSTNGKPAPNGTLYDGTSLKNRFFYGSISEDLGMANLVPYTGGVTSDENPTGTYWMDNISTMTGELTAYENKYAAMLVPWSVISPTEMDHYSAADFKGYVDVNEHDAFYSAKLRINKVDAETGEYILHDNAIFALYAGSRYTSFEEIERDAKLITDTSERERFLTQFRPGDAKFYLVDTEITGSYEFLLSMGATGIKKISSNGIAERYAGIATKGTPICEESEKIMLFDEIGAKTGQMTVFTTLNDVLVAGEKNANDKVFADQNTGYFITPQSVGAGVYVLAEIKSPDGYARSLPVTFEVYSDKTEYYVDGDMYNKASAVRYRQ